MISGMLGWKLAQFTPLVEKHMKVDPPGGETYVESEQRQTSDVTNEKTNTCRDPPTHASQQHQLGQRGLGSLVSLVCNGGT